MDTHSGKALYNLTENTIKPGETVAGVIQFQIANWFPYYKITGKCQIILQARDNKDNSWRFKTLVEEFYKKQTEFIAKLHDVAINNQVNDKIVCNDVHNRKAH